MVRCSALDTHHPPFVQCIHVQYTLYYYHDSMRPRGGSHPLRVPHCFQNGGRVRDFIDWSYGAQPFRVVSVSEFERSLGLYINDSNIVVVKTRRLFRCSNNTIIVSRYSYSIHYDAYETATTTTMIIITVITITQVVMINSTVSTGRQTSSTRRR